MKMNNYHRIKLMEFEQNIRAVTTNDIREELDRIYKLPATFVVRGDENSMKAGREAQWKRKIGCL